MTRRLWSTVFFLGVLATLTWAQVRPIVTPGGGGGGAPTDATYITQTANGSLSAEQALSALGSGLVLNTTGTGVLSIYGGAAGCAAGQYVTALSAAGATTCTAQAAPSFPITAPNAGALRTGTTVGDTLLLQAYDTDTGPAYTTLLTLTSGTTPSMTGLFGEGTNAAPSVALGAAGTGLYIANGYPRYAVSGAAKGGWFSVGGADTFFSVAGYDISGNGDTLFRREGASILQFNDDANAAIAAFTIKNADGITGTDKAGGDFIVAAGRGTGAGAPGTLIFQTSAALGSGTTAQTLATRLIIGATGAATFGTTAGTGTGAVYADTYYTGTTVGCSGTPTAAIKGIATTCTEPVPDPLTQTEVNDLRGLLSQMRGKG